MKIVVQRVSEADVTIASKVNGSILNGLLILLGIELEDTQADADWIIQKIVQLRIFSDDAGKGCSHVDAADILVNLHLLAPVGVLR